MEEWDAKTIVLGYDGTNGSRRAAVVAARLARALEARIVVTTAFPHYPRIKEPDEKDAVEIEKARETAAEMVAALQERGIQAESDELEGPAGEAIVNSAAAHEAGLIVVGSRGHGELAGLLLGSISEYVAHHAQTPVLIAR